MDAIQMPTMRDYLQAHGSGDNALTAILLDIATRCCQIADMLRYADMHNLHGEHGEVNVQGEDQKKLDVISNDVFLELLAHHPQIAALASEEMEDIVINPSRDDDAAFLLVFDPLDGSSNLASNGPVGSIFSILPCFDATTVSSDSFMQAGEAQLAAGYAQYGAATTIFLTIGQGTHGFVRDADDAWRQVKTDVQVLELREYAINHSNERHWTAPIKKYIDDCRAGKSGELGANYNMRWVGAMVAEASRILSRGGVFLYPQDNKDPSKAGRIRLLYEAAPIAFLFEQAGGGCISGNAESAERMMSVVPTDLHQRIGVIFGSKNEVARIAQYYENNA